MKPRRGKGPLPQEGYVWQRVWTPQVQQGVQAAAGKFAGLVVLAAEVEWLDGQPRLIRPKLDYRTLAALPMPLTLAMRIGPFPGPYGREETRTRQLAAWFKEVLQEASEAGCTPQEVQIDFDAATGKLAGYQLWLEVLQTAVQPIPLSFTALPDWLHSPILQAMARQTGRFVLQVHAVERAAPHSQTPWLIDPQQARSWTEQAAALGVPFRVALPTYRSVVGFDAAGKIVGIDSEGPQRKWPEGTRRVAYLSPPEALAGLVRGWTEDRPEFLSGLLWYRLPVPGERRNWSWATLDSVMAGKTPLPKVQASAQGSNPVDLILRNLGDADADWPARVSVALPASGASILAGDALSGYAFVPDADHPQRAEFQRRGDSPDAFLAPGEEKSLGWLRLDATTADHEITLTLS